LGGVFLYGDKYIMRYKEFLIERVLNLHTPEEKMPYAEIVWDMLQRSYKKIGGFKSAANLEELVNEPGYWKLIKRDGRITAVNIYKKSPKTKTFKVIASATETDYNPEKDSYKATPKGLSDYEMIKKGDVKMKRSWAEVSGPAEVLMRRSGATPVPNEYAEFLTGKKILELNDDGHHYTRLIHGEPHEKIIYGFIKLSDEGREELESRGINIRELPKNMEI
jgi:hypothetical protein